MDWSGKCAVVIPCFNEAAGIAGLVAAVRCHLPTVIVVDDGSSDETAVQARSAGAEVIGLPRNQGKGAALRAGLQHLHARRFEWALALDGDGQHCPADILGFFTCAEMTNADLIIGNRFARADAMPRLRRSVNRWMSRRLSVLCGQSLADSQCGFRLMRLARLEDLGLCADHFEIESEILVAFVRLGCRVEFVPVKTLYHAGRSKIDPVVDGWRWLRWWWAQCRTGRSAPPRS